MVECLAREPQWARQRWQVRALPQVLAWQLQPLPPQSRMSRQVMMAQ